MKRCVALSLVVALNGAPVLAQSAADCARQAQDYANLVAPKSGGKVLHNSVDGVIVPVPQRNTTQLARGRDGSSVSGFARIDQYGPNRQAQWIGEQRCQMRR